MFLITLDVLRKKYTISLIKMELENGHCFICCDATVKSINSNEGNLLNELGRTDRNSLLSKNLEVIFILKKLLEVPSIHLENQLKVCGSDPGSWIRLCDQCTQLTRNARKLDQEIIKIEKQLTCVQKQVVEKMISSRFPQEDYDDLKQKTFINRDSLTFETKIRTFVKTYNYANNLIWKDAYDPGGFLEGDKLAKYLTTQQNSSIADILLVENEKPNVIPKEEVKLEVEPPPSPSSSPPPMSPAEEEDPFNQSSSSEVSEDDDEDYVKKKRKIKRKTMAKKKTPERKGSIRRRCKWEKDFNGKLIGNGEIKCGACWRKLKGGKNWSEHVRIKHGRREVRCPVEECGMEFKDNFVKFQEHWKKEHLEFEQKRKHKTPKRQEHKTICNYCGKEMESWEMLKKHKNNKHYNRNGEPKGHWICDICGETDFNCYRALQRHRKIKHKVNMKGESLKVDQDAVKKKKEMEKVLCNLCGKEYCDKWSLDKHLKLVHDKQLDFSCHVCGLGIGHQRDLDMHLLARHKEDPVSRKLEEEDGYKLVRCGMKGCNSKYLRQEELDKHMEKMHKGGKVVNRFECEVCGMGFWLKKRLEMHQRVHEKKERRLARKLKCDRCGKLFDKEKSLKGHQRMAHKVLKQD